MPFLSMQFFDNSTLFNRTKVPFFKEWFGKSICLQNFLKWAVYLRAGCTKICAHLGKFWRQIDFPNYTYKKWTLNLIFSKVGQILCCVRVTIFVWSQKKFTSREWVSEINIRFIYFTSVTSTLKNFICFFTCFFPQFFFCYFFQFY